MPKRIYIGSHAAVEVPLPTGESVTVAKGASAEFDDETTRSLDVSGAWSTVTPTKPDKGAATND